MLKAGVERERSFRADMALYRIKSRTTSVFASSSY